MSFIYLLVSTYITKQSLYASAAVMQKLSWKNKMDKKCFVNSQRKQETYNVSYASWDMIFFLLLKDTIKTLDIKKH